MKQDAQIMDSYLRIDNEGDFYPWECVSLVRNDNTTLDLVVRESPSEIMAFLHVVFTIIHNLQND